jgi:uncharacterized protein YceH (UPF0502 family)
MQPLTAEEARVLGCLIEKAMTTPDYYPLTVNALVSACNQKTNREPVVSYDDDTVDGALRSLDHAGLVGITRASGGRSLKYFHHADEQWQVDDEQLALLAVLLLRGPQTPGELRIRTDRYIDFASTAAVEERLADLIYRDVPLVERLEREPGQKENRYRTVLMAAQNLVPAQAPPDLEARLAALEAEVERIKELLVRPGDSPGDEEPSLG